MCNLSEGIEERGRRKGRNSLLFQLVDEGDLSVEKAAEKANMTVEEFLKKKSEWEGNSPS